MDNLEFRNLNYIVFMIIPVIGVLLMVFGYHRKEKILQQLKLKIRLRFKLLRIIFLLLGLVMTVFSLVGPQMQKGLTEVESNGLDIYVLFDTSKSMLTDDIKPDRISSAKKVLEELIDNLEGDRIGFIPFTSSSYIQMPLTDDYQLARMFLDVIDTDMISGSGTDIGSAIELASKSFEHTGSSDSVILIISDGEEHDSNSVEVLKKINRNDLHVFTIGIGTKKGGLIPIYDEAGMKVVDYMKDNNGEYVTSKLIPDTLKALASEGKGSYYQSTVTGEEVDRLLTDISALKRDTLKTGKVSRYRQLYQYSLGIGMLFLLLAYLLPERSEK